MPSSPTTSVPEEIRIYLCKKYTKPYEEMRSDLQEDIDNTVNLIAPFIKSYGDRRELEGQESLLNRLEDAGDLTGMQADYWLSTTGVAKSKLEFQKEKL